MVGKTAVIGAGIVGLSSALALQRAGRSVLLIDPARETPPASWGNAGHVAIEQVVPIASLATLRSAPRRLAIRGGALGLPPREIARWLPFALRLTRASTPRRHAEGHAVLAELLAAAMPAWRRLSASLPRDGLLLENGHAVVWHDPRAAAEGLAAWQATDTGTARFHVADADERAALGQVMARPPTAAIIFENTGQVADPGAVGAALRAAFQAAGGAIVTDAVRAIESEAGRAVLRLASGTRLSPAEIVVAAGVESGELLRPLGLRVPIIAERGYHVQAVRHRWPAGMPPVVFEERSMIVTAFESGLRAAGFVEFGSLGKPGNPRHWETLERHVAELGLPVDGPVTRWVGARPTLPDYLPAIGRAPQADNLFYAFGHQHLGLTLGPLTGEIVAEMIIVGVSGNPALTLARFQ